MTEIIPPPAVLFVALLHAPCDSQECIRELTEMFGPVAEVGPSYPMAAFSRYYEKEMGAGLQKQFISFERPVPMDRLARCKRETQTLEKKFQSEPGKRLFNIDPGLVTSYSVILSTSKNHAHRIYLRQGIFAEVTLIFRRRCYHPLPWTYPDYQSPSALRFFEQVRARVGKEVDGTQKGESKKAAHKRQPPQQSRARGPGNDSMSHCRVPKPHVFPPKSR